MTSDNFSEYNLHNVIIWHRCIVKHFTYKTYDCIKKNYHINGHDTYLNNNMKKFKSHYVRLMKSFNTSEEIKLFFVVCCLYNINDVYKICEMFPKLFKLYQYRLNIYNNLETYFKKDTSYIIEKYGSIRNSIKVKEDMSCGIVNCFFKKEIHVETLLILNDICNIFKTINKVEDDNILWKNEFHKVNKYGSFINGFDKDYFVNLLDKQTA